MKLIDKENYAFSYDSNISIIGNDISHYVAYSAYTHIQHGVEKVIHDMYTAICLEIDNEINKQI